MWAELRREAQLLGASSDEAVENTPFNPAEQEEIARRLRELREHAARTASLSEEQMLLLDGKINYLVQAAGHLGRVHWRDVFAGTMLTLIFTTALPPESVRHILVTLLKGVGHHYGFGFPELPSGF